MPSKRPLASESGLAYRTQWTLKDIEALSRTAQGHWNDAWARATVHKDLELGVALTEIHRRLAEIERLTVALLERGEYAGDEPGGVYDI
jgi:hypothetical protein